MATTKGIVAQIEGGALGAGYSVRVEERTETVDHIHVTRYGRQQRGYVRIDDGAVDLAQLNIAGMSDDSVMAALMA
jgi:hypothetical protein